MKHRGYRGPVAFLLAMALLHLPAATGLAGESPLGRMVPQGKAQLNGERLEVETTLYTGDTVATAADSVAVLLLAGQQVNLAPSSSVQLASTDGSVVASLEQGALAARSRRGQSLVVRAHGLLVRPEGAARYEVALAEEAVVVSAREGSVTVEGTNEAVAVPAGRTMRFELARTVQAPAGAGVSGIGPGAAAAITIAVSLGVGIPVSWWIADKLADDARRDACNQIRSGLSPAAAAAITCR
jgi:hypothetical protein